MKKGFTLIEILIVVTIIGVLSTMGVYAYLSAQPRARDARRKSDTEQYKNALEVYATRNNSFYPSQNAAGGTLLSTVVCANLGLTKCPEDPLNSVNSAAYHYLYQSNGTGAGTPTATKYFIWGPVENPAVGAYWVTCSNGKSGQISGWPVNGSLGDCPNGL